MASELNIEQPGELLGYLRASGRLAAQADAVCAPLSGGVSNRTVLVRLSTGDAWVVKQALPKLRVAEAWFSDPARIRLEALGLQWFGELGPPGSVPALIFEDPERHLLAMRAVPEPHENWKQALLGGRVEHAHVEQFGHWLGTVHRRSHERQEEVRPVFEDRTFFKTLRLDPYYRAAAARNPEAAAFFAELIDDTLAERRCLTHGDYSPKNVLIHSGRLVLLDFEVAHFGDPAFDLGFALTHLLSKAHHLPACRPAFLAAAGGFWRAYREAAGAMAADAGLEGRAARHALACLLARIDGRSPLEYLSPVQQARQRGWVRQLIRAPARRLPELIDSWARLLESRA